jgi:hypothetical protein
MDSSQPAKGRGRPRVSANPTGPPAPAITSSTDASASSTPATIDTPTTSVISTTDVSAITTPTTATTSRPDTGFSSASSGFQPSATSSPTVPKGRGRGGERLKQKLSPEDPHWTVTKLDNSQFYSNTRPTKPDELGILGDQIQVIANYFPILQYPHQGLVYRYHIQIRNRKNLEIHRDLRR